MDARMIAAAAMLAATGGFFSANAQDGTLIGMQVDILDSGSFNLVKVQTSTGQVTTLAHETGVFRAPLNGSEGYNILTNTYSFAYTPSSNINSPVFLRTIDATTGQTVSDVQLTSPLSSPPFYVDLTPLTPITGDFTAISTTGLATLNSASVTNGLSVGGGATIGGALSVAGLSILSGGVQTTTVNAATSVTTPIITATTGNIQTVNVGGAFNAAGGATINMGGNRLQNVAAPIVATDAATKGYVDASVGGVANSFNNGLNQALKKIDQNSQGIAIAMAMSGVTLSADKNAVIGGNVGFYNGKQAAAFQGAIRVGRDVTVNGGIGFGFQDRGQVGGRVGMQVEF